MKEETLGAKVGSILVIVYALASIVSAASSFFCTATLCKAALAFPVLPWPLFLAPVLEAPVALYPLLLLLNASLIYGIGVFLGFLFELRAKKNNW